MACGINFTNDQFCSQSNWFHNKLDCDVKGSWYKPILCIVLSIFIQTTKNISGTSDISGCRCDASRTQGLQGSIHWSSKSHFLFCFCCCSLSRTDVSNSFCHSHLNFAIKDLAQSFIIPMTLYPLNSFAHLIWIPFQVKQLIFEQQNLARYESFY